MIVRYNGRNQDTPRYMPVMEREEIQPMKSEFEGPGAMPAVALGLIIGVAIWAMVIAAWLS